MVPTGQPDRQVFQYYAPDTEARARMLLETGAIPLRMLEMIAALVKGCPYFQNAERIDSLVEDAEEMGLEGFEMWIEALKQKHA